jgi:hypothetical protein
MPDHVWKHHGLQAIAARIGDDGVYRPGGVMAAPPDVAPLQHAHSWGVIDATNASEFAGPYAERGDAIAELLDAVSSGATLEIHGPTATNTRIRAFIESATGSRGARATGTAIGPVLVELARKWKDSAR